MSYMGKSQKEIEEDMEIGVYDASWYITDFEDDNGLWLEENERESSAKTAYYWLHDDRRKIKDGEKPHLKEFYLEILGFLPDDRLYYYPEQTEPVVDDEEFEQLDKLYGFYFNNT